MGTPGCGWCGAPPATMLNPIHPPRRMLAVLTVERVGMTANNVTYAVLGGPPFGEQIVMWWNFIGRDHDEIVAAREDWENHSGRFGTVDGHDGQRIPAPPMPALRLKPRVRQG